MRAALRAARTCMGVVCRGVGGWGELVVQRGAAVVVREGRDWAAEPRVREGSSQSCPYMYGEACRGVGGWGEPVVVREAVDLAAQLFRLLGVADAGSGLTGS